MDFEKITPDRDEVFENVSPERDSCDKNSLEKSVDLEKISPDRDECLERLSPLPDTNYGLEKVSPERNFELEKVSPKRDLELEKISSKGNLKLEKISPERDLELEKVSPERDLELEKVSPERDLELERVSPDRDLELEKVSPERDLELENVSPERDLELEKVSPERDLELEKISPDRDVELGEKSRHKEEELEKITHGSEKLDRHSPDRDPITDCEPITPDRISNKEKIHLDEEKLPNTQTEDNEMTSFISQKMDDFVVLDSYESENVSVGPQSKSNNIEVSSIPEKKSQSKTINTEKVRKKQGHIVYKDHIVYKSIFDKVKHQLKVLKRRDPERSKRDIEMNKFTATSRDILKKMESGLVPPGMELEFDVPEPPKPPKLAIKETSPGRESPVKRYDSRGRAISPRGGGGRGRNTPPRGYEGRRITPPRGYEGRRITPPRRVEGRGSTPPRRYENRGSRSPRRHDRRIERTGDRRVGERDRREERLSDRERRYVPSGRQRHEEIIGNKPFYDISTSNSHPVRRSRSRSPQRRTSQRQSPHRRSRSPNRHGERRGNRGESRPERSLSQERFLKALVQCSGILNEQNTPPPTEINPHIGNEMLMMHPPFPPPHCFGPPGPMFEGPPMFDVPPMFGPPGGFEPAPAFDPPGPLGDGMINMPSSDFPFNGAPQMMGTNMDATFGTGFSLMDPPVDTSFPPPEESVGIPLKLNLLQQKICENFDNITSKDNKVKQTCKLANTGDSFNIVPKNKIAEVKAKCKEAVNKLSLLHYQNKIVHFVEYVLPPSHSQSDKPSPLNRQPEPTFRYTSKSNNHGHILLSAIIATLDMEHTFQQRPDGYYDSVTSKDSATQTDNYRCNDCDAKLLTCYKSKGVNTVHVSSVSVRTQVEESELASTKSMFTVNKNSSESNEEIVSLTHMTPAQILIAELTAKAKSFQNTSMDTQKSDPRFGASGQAAEMYGDMKSKGGWGNQGDARNQGSWGGQDEDLRNYQGDNRNQGNWSNAKGTQGNVNALGGQGSWNSPGDPRNQSNWSSPSGNQGNWGIEDDSNNSGDWNRGNSNMNQQMNQSLNSQFGSSLRFQYGGTQEQMQQWAQYNNNQRQVPKMKKKFDDFKRKLN